MKAILNPNSIDDYRMFLRIKSLPAYRVRGRVAEFPDEYAGRIGLAAHMHHADIIETHPDSFDYQAACSRLAIEKRKFALFIRCGFGKTLCFLDFARHAAKVLRSSGKRVLMTSPLMVIEQTVAEAKRFYPDMEIEIVKASELADWTTRKGTVIGITNYEALTEDVSQGNLGALIVDESSMMKSMYGKWGQQIIRLGKGLDWKLAGTGTPAPNDRIEYANHAVFLDHAPNTNAFLGTYFVNRGQTQERWVLKPHALGPFYRALSHWSIFLTNPAVYGWKDNCGTIPPINVKIHNVELTGEQEAAVQKHTGGLFAHHLGGIVGRNALGRIAKGKGGMATNKPQFIRDLVDSFGNKQTLIWCIYNDEQDGMAAMFPNAANISGDTPHAERMKLIAEFKRGERKVLISKSKILGFGLNLQCVTKMVFSGLQDSYEGYHQCIARANRCGSTEPLDVHIPVTDVEIPMVENVLRKAKRVDADTAMQERIFCEAAANEGRISGGTALDAAAWSAE